MYLNKIFTYLMVFLTFLLSRKCRYPLNQKKSFLNSSAKRNKLLLAREEIMIKKALIKKDTH